MMHAVGVPSTGGVSGRAMLEALITGTDSREMTAELARDDC
jgi:hypothetical protein